jgi:hypothetical protein
MWGGKREVEKEKAGKYPFYLCASVKKSGRPRVNDYVDYLFSLPSSVFFSLVIQERCEESPT